MTNLEPEKEAIDDSAERQEQIIEQITALFQQQFSTGHKFNTKETRKSFLEQVQAGVGYEPPTEARDAC